MAPTMGDHCRERKGKWRQTLPPRWRFAGDHRAWEIKGRGGSKPWGRQELTERFQWHMRSAGTCGVSATAHQTLTMLVLMSLNYGCVMGKKPVCQPWYEVTRPQQPAGFAKFIPKQFLIVKCIFSEWLLLQAQE